jgi:sec-independent protein translocase protein TatC
MATTERSESNEFQMDLFEHLNELRSRLFKALIGLVVTTIASFALADRFLQLLARPIGGLQKLQAIEVTESIGVFMRVALLSGVILAMPIIVYQLLSFIMPGLHPNEKKWLYLSVPFASLLFLSGVVFSYLVMLPAAVPFLTSFLGINANIRISNYINFVTNLMFWIGVSFETPLLVFVLAKMHIVNGKMLAKQWRIALVVIAVIAAMVTPTVDPVNMGLLMAPLFVLYLLSVLLAFLAK